MEDSTKSSTKPLQTFTCFKNLPPELRLMIWEKCLPHRSVQMHDSAHRDIERELEHTEPPAGPLPPLIGRVCRESRDVALKHGGVEETAFWDTSVWFNRRTDNIFIGTDDYDQWLPSRSGESTNKGMERLVYDRNIPLSIDRGVVLSHSGFPTGYEFAIWTLERAAERTECNVVLYHATMHATHEQAIASGLFGHFAEETTIYINIEDTKKIQTLVAACDMLLEQSSPTRDKTINNELPWEPPPFRLPPPLVPLPLPNDGLFGLKDYLTKNNDPFDSSILSFQERVRTLWLKMNGTMDANLSPSFLFFFQKMEEQEPHRSILARLPKFNYVVAVHLKKAKPKTQRNVIAPFVGPVATSSDSSKSGQIE
ncbi:hypothetical protein F4811DRAFT_570323 [Daldinia bambusicola]|nr:hypothetical protein F4811DRAFT_570323 [Daldinia bambusicola]